MTIRSFITSSALIGATLAQAPIPHVPIRIVRPEVAPPLATPPPEPAVASVVPIASTETRAIDLVLCLDTSNSMDDLIQSARQHLWSIVNEMATLKPQPKLRVALLAYGSPAFGADQGFVRVATELTGDLDLVSQRLFELKTNGGQEYVARAVLTSLTSLKWSDDPSALKMIVVAGNEAATQDPAHPVEDVAKQAIERGILINTVFCGSQQKPEAESWRAVARRADGKFMAIESSQLAVIATPFDEQLASLSKELNGTYLVYGNARLAWASNQTLQDSNASTLNPTAAALRCQTKGSALYFNPSYDLVDACKDAKFDLTKIPAAELPEVLRGKSVAEKKAHIDRMTKKRLGIQKQVAELASKRELFVVKERQRLGESQENSFEKAMLQSIRAQATARGFEVKAAPKLETVEKAPTHEPAPKPEQKPGPSAAAAPVKSQVIEIVPPAPQLLR